MRKICIALTGRARGGVTLLAAGLWDQGKVWVGRNLKSHPVSSFKIQPSELSRTAHLEALHRDISGQEFL